MNAGKDCKRLGVGIGYGSMRQKVGDGKVYRVSDIDTALEGVLEQRQRFIFVQDPWLKRAGAVGHGVEDLLRS